MLSTILFLPNFTIFSSQSLSHMMMIISVIIIMMNLTIETQSIATHHHHRYGSFSTLPYGNNDPNFNESDEHHHQRRHQFRSHQPHQKDDHRSQNVKIRSKQERKQTRSVAHTISQLYQSNSGEHSKHLQQQLQQQQQQQQHQDHQQKQLKNHQKLLLEKLKSKLLRNKRIDWNDLKHDRKSTNFVGRKNFKSNEINNDDDRRDYDRKDSHHQKNNDNSSYYFDDDDQENDSVEHYQSLTRSNHPGNRSTMNSSKKTTKNDENFDNLRQHPPKSSLNHYNHYHNDMGGGSQSNGYQHLPHQSYQSLNNQINEQSNPRLRKFVMRDQNHSLSSTSTLTSLMPISLNEINRLLQSSSSSSSSNSRVKSLDSPLDDKKLWNHLTQPTISKTVLDNELDQIKSEIINSYQPNKSNNLIGKQIAAYLTIADKKIGKELREGLKNSREDGVDARGVEPKSESEKLFLEIASTPSISGQQSTTLNLDRLLGKTVYYNPSAKISDFVDLALSSGSIKNNQKQSTKSAKNENNSNQKLSPHMNDGFELIKDSHAQESSKLSTTTLLLPQSTAIATKEGLRLNPIELFESDQIRLYELSSQPRSSSSTQLLSFVKEQQTPTPLLRTARIQLIPITTEPSDRFVMHTATPFHKWPAIRELSLPILAASPSFVTTNRFEIANTVDQMNIDDFLETNARLILDRNLIDSRPKLIELQQQQQQQHQQLQTKQPFSQHQTIRYDSINEKILALLLALNGQKSSQSMNYIDQSPSSSSSSITQFLLRPSSSSLLKDNPKGQENYEVNLKRQQSPSNEQRSQSSSTLDLTMIMPTSTSVSTPKTTTAATTATATPTTTMMPITTSIPNRSKSLNSRALDHSSSSSASATTSAMKSSTTSQSNFPQSSNQVPRIKSLLWNPEMKTILVRLNLPDNWPLSSSAATTALGKRITASLANSISKSSNKKASAIDGNHHLDDRDHHQDQDDQQNDFEMIRRSTRVPPLTSSSSLFQSRVDRKQKINSILKRKPFRFKSLDFNFFPFFIANIFFNGTFFWNDKISYVGV
ncbi:hypothetical protein SSS_07355 [Sarcoptes scabiei]|uniref:Uncharacterized protein n=1 Tax=Sarcoptes scabiei TaxID=52283 RepID=A0A834VIF9_SARSC|nr:hypothetical protein SSS_07355 [Sarcoptes scabiei]